MTDSKKIQLETSLDATGVRTGANEVKREVQSMAQSVTQASQAAGKAVDSIGNGGAASAKKVESATNSMIQSIQRTTALMEAGSKTSAKYYETLASQRGVDVSALRPYLDQLDAVAAKQRQAQQALGATDNGLKGVGISAAQTANALRMVPAQLTDIVTSLASGQAPLTVLIQQGGQLKDSFGGIVPAARALGSYVAGLVNPLTLAAAAAGTLAVAYNQGSKEADAYSRALVLTGNAAGTTAGLLTLSAQNISRFTGTQSQAAAALAELAGTGRIAGTNLEYFSRVAVQMEKSVGQSVAETAKDLAELGKSPVEASERLNEKYRYLTATVYEQIQALQDQGKTEEAAALAQQTYAKAFDDRTKELKSNLGVIESAWGSVIGAAKKGWDAILDVGRKETLQEKLTGVSEQIRTYNPFAIFGPSLDQLKQQQAAIQEMIRLERQGATAAADNARQNEARIAWMKDGDKYLSRAAQMEKEINVAREQGIRAGVSQAEIETRVGEIRKKYSDIFNDGVNSQIEALKQRSQIEEVLAQRSLEQLQANKSLGLVSERDYIEQVAKIELDAFDKKRKNLEAELSFAAGKQNSLKEQAALSGQLAILDEQRLTRSIKLSNDLAILEDKRKKQAQNVITDQLIEDEKARADYDRRYGESMNSAIKLVNDYGRAIDENNALTAYEITLLGQTETSRNTALSQYRIQLDLEKEILRIKELGLTAEDQAQQIARAREAAARASEGATTRVTLDYWRRINEDISRSLTDELVRGGKNAGQLIMNYFKTLTLRPVIEAFLSPISGAITAAFLPTAAQAVSTGNSTMGMASNLYSAGSAAYSAYGGLAGFYGGFTGAAGTNTANAAMLAYAQQTGNLSTSAALGSQAGSYAGAVGSAATVAAGVAGGVYGGRAISNGYSAWGSGSGNSAVNSGTAAGAAVGTYILPGIGTAIGALIGGLLGGIVNRGFGDKVVGNGIMGSVKGGDFSGNFYEFSKGGWFGGNDGTETFALEKKTADSFDFAAESLQKTFADLGKTVGAGGETMKNFAYDFRLALKDFDDAGKEKEIARLMSAMADSAALQFVDNFRTTIDIGLKEYQAYFTNTIDGQREFNFKGLKAQERLSSPLDPYIEDMVRIFDTFRESIKGVEGTEGQLSAFVTQLFNFGDALVENKGYLAQFGEALDFDKLEAAANRGESVFDTFARLNSVFAVTNDLALTLGRELTSGFGAIGLASTAARESLIAAAGGIEALSSQTAFYAQNFLSAEQQEALARKQLKNALDPVGLGDIDTKDEYTTKVGELFGKTDEASQKLLATLLQLGPAILNVSNYTQAAADKAIEDAKAAADAQAAAAQAAKEAAQASLQAVLDKAMEGVSAAMSGVQRAVDAERTAATNAYNAAVKDFNKQIQDINGSVGKLSSLSSNLKSTLGSMRLDSQLGMEKAAASAQIQAALAIAKAGGVLPDADALQQALSIAAQSNEDLYATFAEAQFAYLKDKAAIGELAKLTDSALSVEEQTLKSLQDQLGVTEQAYQAEMERLDGVLEYAQQQVDILNGIDTSVKSVGSAIANLQIKISAAAGAQAQVGNSSGSTAPSITGLYSNILGREADAAGAAFWQNAMIVDPKSWDAHVTDFLKAAVATGGADAISAIDYAREHGIPGFAGGGSHFGGLRLVGENGPEIEATGPARIFNASQTADILRGATGNNELAAEIRAVLADNEQLRKDLKEVLDRVAESSERTADIIENVTDGGNAMRTEELA